jgi:hypothetical protein
MHGIYAAFGAVHDLTLSPILPAFTVKNLLSWQRDSWFVAVARVALSNREKSPRAGGHHIGSGLELGGSA